MIGIDNLQDITVDDWQNVYNTLFYFPLMFILIILDVLGII